MQPFDITVTNFKGIRQDIGEKYLPKECAVNLKGFNFDPIVGMDKIKERQLVNTSELNAGEAIDGIYQYNYFDTNNLTQTVVIAVSGGSVYRDWDSLPILLYSGLQAGRCTFATHQNKLFIANGKDFTIVYDGQIGKVYQIGAPVPLAGTVAGSPNGAYKYAITFTTDGGEEYTGTVSPSITVSSLQINVQIPIGYSGTISRTLYRTLAGGSVYYLLAAIPNNLDLTYVDNIADATLVTGSDQLANLTCLWHFNESTGTTAADTKGLANLTLQTTFTDNFTGATLNPIWTDNGGSSVSGGELILHDLIYTNIPPSTQTIECKVNSNTHSGALTGLIIRDGSGHNVRLYCKQGTDESYLYTQDGFITRSGGSLGLYGKYLKMDITDKGSIKCYISSDGTTWTLWYTLSISVYNYTQYGLTCDNYYGHIEYFKGVSLNLPFIPGLLNNAISISNSSTPFASWSTALIASTPTAGTFTGGANADFQFSDWIKISENSGDSIRYNFGGTKLIFAGHADGTQTLATGKAHIISIDTTTHSSADNYPVGVWFRFVYKRTSGTTTLQWTTSEESSYNTTARITLTDASALSSNTFEIDVYCYSGTTSFVLDEMRWSNAKSFSTAINTFWWNVGHGTESTYGGGATPIIGVNNESPKPYFLTVANRRLIGAVSDKDQNQAWATDALLELFDYSNGIDVTFQYNDNSPLTGMINDYKSVVLTSEKNIYLADFSQDPVPVYITRASIGCVNGYTLIFVPQYKEFEGGVMILSSLNDFRLFNSNFSQPLISSAYAMTQAEGVTDWSRAVSPILAGLDLSLGYAEFFDYKYHVAFKDKILVFDIRTQGWTEYENQDANVFGFYNYKLYVGRNSGSYIDQMYATDLNNGAEFNASFESVALMADEEKKFFKDLYFYFKNNGVNDLSLQVIYEDDYNNTVSQSFKLNINSVVLDDYRVFHLSRWSRWVKFILTSTSGRFMFRGFRLTGDQKDKKE